MNIGLLGGTFNPIHYGHLRLAEEVREAMGLDKVLFVPAFIPPHKPDEKITPAGKRLEMVRLAIRDNPGFESSDIEIKRGDRSYTVVTLRELKERGPKELSVSLIIGTDSFNDITTWCEYEEIFELSGLVVVERPGYPVKKIAEVVPEGLARKFRYERDNDSYVSSYGTAVTYLKTTLMEISSSGIRERVRAGLSIRYLLPGAVADYIEEEGLYRRP